MKLPKFSEAVGGFLTVGAMASVSWLAIRMGSSEAQTALINVLMFGAGWFLRGKVQPPT